MYNINLMNYFSILKATKYMKKKYAFTMIEILMIALVMGTALL
jgi:competence protein ComGC